MRPGRGATMSESRAGHDDDVYLRQFGVEPKLKRAIGYISSSLFAIAFQGPTTGALLLTGAPLFFCGPAFIWSIPLIFLFHLLVALSWAELSSHYPLEGGIYQWAKYLGGEGVGWATGLFYLVAIILVMPAVGLVINIVLSGVFPDQIKFNSTTEIVISFLTIIATALIMSTSVRVVALINNIGVTLELIVLLGAAILLLGHVHQPLSVLFTTGGVEAKGSYIVPFLIVVALVLTRLAGNGEPVICIVVAALLSMVPLLFVQQIPVLIAAITFMILIPYFLVLASLIRRRLAGWPTTDAPFKLGAWGTPLAVIGIVWVGFVAIDAAWPRAATNP